MKYQKLFDHMREAHGLILLESEMEEIVRVVNECKSDNDSSLCCPECLSLRVLEFKDKYQCRLCYFNWEKK